MRAFLHSSSGWMSIPPVLAVGLAYGWIVGRILRRGPKAHLRTLPDFLNRPSSVVGRILSTGQRQADDEEKRSLRIYEIFREYVSRE